MASFLTGLVRGGVDETTKLKKGGNFRNKKKKGQQGSGETDTEGTMSFRRGGRVKRTGLARVHKGERVLTTKEAKRYRSKRR